MKSISILGCGWLGLPLGKHLVELGYPVKGSTTQESKLISIKNESIRSYLLSFNPTLEGDPSDFFASDLLILNLPPRNRNGIAAFHENQLKAIHQYAKGKTKQVLFISSTAVYPSLGQEVFESDADSTCLTRAGIPLLEMEKIFSADQTFSTTVIRFGGLYGPDRHPGRFLAGKKNLAGANNPVNMIHLDDCIGVIQTIIEQNLWGEVFNACAPSNETRKSYYEKASKELDLEAPTFSDEPAHFKKVNANKLIDLTGYRFRH